MPGQIPAPIAQSFVVCRQIIHDQRTNQFVLLAPFSRLPLPPDAFPTQVAVSVYAQLTGGHGHYDVALALRDWDEEVLWKWEPGGLQQRDPLVPHELSLNDMPLPFPRPGKYELVLLASGQVIARHILWIGQPEKWVG